MIVIITVRIFTKLFFGVLGRFLLNFWAKVRTCTEEFALHEQVHRGGSAVSAFSCRTTSDCSEPIDCDARSIIGNR